MRKFSTVQNAGFPNILSFHIIDQTLMQNFYVFLLGILSYFGFLLLRNISLLCNRSEHVRKTAYLTAQDWELTHVDYRVFSLTWPASMQIYWNKRNRLHKKRVQLPQDWFGHQHGRLFFVLGHHMNVAAVTSREVLITYGLCYNAVIRSNPLAMRTNYFFPPPPLALSSFLIQYLTIRTRYRKLRQILADK